MTRPLITALLLLALTASPLSAQKLNLDFPALAERAAEVVDVTLDAQLLRAAAKFFSGRDAEERSIREMVQRLEGVYVRSYRFDNAGEYDRRIAESVRRQLGPSWKKIVNVRSRNRENVDVFTDMRGENIVGLVVIAAEPKELTLVNIVGSIDLERLAELEGHFGIPHVSVEKKRERQ